MGVERLEIIERSAYLNGESFSQVGPYERIDAVARYAVDPTNVANAPIVDLALVERGDDGLVRFDGDVTVLRPINQARARRAALVEVPNRGRRVAGGLFNRAPALVEPTEQIDPGDGFLFRHGWTLAWCGWQWDVPRSRARMGLTAPHVIDASGEPETGAVQLRLQLHERVPSIDLTDHHVGLLGGHTTVPTADVDDPQALLLRREGLWGPAVEIPRQLWRFAKDDGAGNPIPDPGHVWLAGGFEPGRIYDLVYRTVPCRVAGVGLLAVRDLGVFLRSNTTQNPSAGELDHLIVTGQSQCGRFLRTYLHLGLNRAEEGSSVYDGVLAHIAGGRQGEFNHRAAQPSVQPTPSFGHRFPFADDAQHDSRTGRVDGLLETQRRVGAVPKIFFTNTSSEYWRGDASLAHTCADDGSDVGVAQEVRHYLFASTQHGPGMLPLTSHSVFGSRGGNQFNIVDYTPLMRAALVNLLAWITDGTEPPPNAVPSQADGTAVDRRTVLDEMAAIPGLARPEAERLSTVRPLDLGPDESRGIGTYPAVPKGDAYPCLVSAVDQDGNERAGIRLPDLTVPVATHTGWNPRHPETGAPEEILEYLGSTAPFPTDQAAREASRDPRLSIAERYLDREDYLARVRTAAQALVASRHLLEEDITICERIAGRRYDTLA